MRLDFVNDVVTIKSEYSIVFNKDTNCITVTGEKVKEKVINTCSKDLKIFVNGSIDLVETFKDCSEVNYSIIVDENCDVNNTMIMGSNNKNINKKMEVLKGVSLNEILVDLGYNQSNISMVIDLNGEHIDCYNRVASIASNVTKNYNIRVNHIVGNSKSKLDNHGVATNSGELYFTATGSIVKNGSKSSMLQNNKIILFDEESKGEIKPLLLIDNNDVNASHAAAVGKVDDNQIFYLCSRGIDEANAKKMIALGYLIPVLEYISDETVKEEISKEIAKI